MHRYALGLGSNRPHGRHGRPAAVVVAAMAAIRASGVTVEAASRPVASAPLGPAARRYANAAAIVATALDPPALLVLLKRIERDFGRRGGRRWGARVIDLDILLWSGGRWRGPGLVIPHRDLPHRRFVLGPLATIAPDLWLPESRLAVRHLLARLRRPAPVDRHRRAP